MLLSECFILCALGALCASAQDNTTLGMASGACKKNFSDSAWHRASGSSPSCSPLGRVPIPTSASRVLLH